MIRYSKKLMCVTIALAGCSDSIVSPSAKETPDLRFTAYTAAAAAPYLLNAYNSPDYLLAAGISDLGVIVGQSGPTNSVRWETGTAATPSSVTPLLVGLGGRALDVNTAGQIAGESFVTGGTEASLWTPSGGGAYTRTNVGLPGALVSTAYAINDKGQVAGSSRIVTGSTWVDKCFVWTPSSDNATTGTVEEIPGLGGTFCVANDINAAGQVVGVSNSASSSMQQAFVRSGGVTLGLQPAGDDTYATSINNGGQIAGWHGAKAAVWNPASGTWSAANDIDVAALSGQSGFISGFAMDINDAGFVAGFTRDASGLDRAFLWNAGTVMELPDANPTTVNATALTNVIDNRLIVAGGGIDNNTGVRRAMRWTVSLTPIITEGCNDRLVRLIGELKAAGVINPGIATSLLSKADASARQAASGKTTPAKNILSALIDEVNALESSRRLTAEQGQALRDAALCVIGSL